MSKTTPNPGSEETVELGCRCPIIDNHYGKGFPYGGAEGQFYINSECTLRNV